MLAELLTQEMHRPRAATCLRDSAIFAALNSGRAGKSIVPCKPRNSTAAKPLCWAKSRIFNQFQPGQPRVEKPIGNDSLPPARQQTRRVPIPIAELWINCRRVNCFMQITKLMKIQRGPEIRVTALRPGAAQLSFPPNFVS